jgi:diaminohydroxyphosphoribosylaminopyrimidine deaminase / 5-amino-6-(5-phosphoribosylamino)uracil reductase
VGVETVLADNPSLLPRGARSSKFKVQNQKYHRLVLDTRARTPLTAQLVTDGFASLTTVVVGRSASRRRVQALAKHVRVLSAPESDGHVDLAWLLAVLGRENVTSLLVEGGGEVNASFLLGGHAHRVAFFYAPKVLGGRDSRPGVAGTGAARLAESLSLTDPTWRRFGPDLFLTARIVTASEI